MKPSIIFWGTPDFAANILQQLIDADQFNILAVVTQPDRPVGRHQVMTPSAVSEIADKYKIQILKPLKLNQDFIDQVNSLGPVDLFVVTAYGKIISQAILDIPKFGAINVHPSLLPKYRGASPIQSALLNGDSETGVSIMLMDHLMDHGPVLNTSQFSLSEKYNYVLLSKELSELSGPLLIKTIDEFLNKNLQPQPQNHELATFCQTITKEDGYFDIENPPSAEKLDQMIRAYYPWPNAWTKWQGKIVKLYPEQQVQMEGKKIVNLSEFLRGYPEFPLKSLIF